MMSSPAAAATAANAMRMVFKSTSPWSRGYQVGGEPYARYFVEDRRDVTATIIAIV
jgi:hypothetical protein